MQSHVMLPGRQNGAEAVGCSVCPVCRTVPPLCTHTHMHWTHTHIFINTRTHLHEHTHTFTNTHTPSRTHTHTPSHNNQAFLLGTQQNSLSFDSGGTCDSEGPAPTPWIRPSPAHKITHLHWQRKQRNWTRPTDDSNNSQTSSTVNRKPHSLSRHVPGHRPAGAPDLSHRAVQTRLSHRSNMWNFTS